MTSLIVRTADRASFAVALGLVTSLAACGGNNVSATHANDTPPLGATIGVTLDHRNLPVDLAKLPHEGSSVPLLTIWSGAYPGEAPAALTFDLLGSDGFRPRSRPSCKPLLTADQASHASVDVVTHNVTFSGGNTPPPCYNVRGLVELDAVR